MDAFETESSGIDSSPDMNSSPEYLSPERLPMLKPRTLRYDESDEPSPAKLNNNIDDDQHENHDLLDEDAVCIGNFKINNSLKTYRQSNLIRSSKMQVLESPPYRKVRALRLFDTPATPKTILEKSRAPNNQTTTTSRYMKSLTPNPESFGYFTVKPPTTEDTLAPNPSTPSTQDRPKPFPLHNKTLDLSANINPFSPLNLTNKKRQRTQLANDDTHAINTSLFRVAIGGSQESLTNGKTNALPSPSKDMSMEETETELDDRQAPKRLALQDSNIPRYEKEFVELSLIGVGQFGVAYQCLNRLDGCVYAIKKSIKPVAGSVFEKTALNEVYAHAVLGKHDNVVRYYSAWAENRHMLIQNEYCNGGSLQLLLQGRSLVETELRTLLMHIADGLRYIHSNDLVHMDLKSGNIFLTKVPIRSHQPTSHNYDGDDGFEDIFEELEYEVTYKIGDLGHVTSIKNPQVEEGDCRYLPTEILQEDFLHLDKADIFSLGITLFEAGGGGALPKNGQQWHDLREGRVPDLPNISREFNDLIKLMTHPDPGRRPSSTSIFQHPVLCPSESKSKSQLCHELSIEKKKNELLMRKLRETKKIVRSYESSRTPLSKKSGLIESDRQLRSYSRSKKRSPVSLRRGGYRDRNKNIT